MSCRGLGADQGRPRAAAATRTTGTRAAATSIERCVSRPPRQSRPPVVAESRLVVARVAGQQHLADARRGRTFGCTGATSPRRARRGAHRPSSASASRCLIVGNTSISSSALVGLERVGGPRASARRRTRCHPRSPRRRAGAAATKNQVSKRILTSRGRDPAREAARARGRRELRFRPPPRARAPPAARVVGVLGVHGAAREDPCAAHEALLRVALDEQHLGAVRRVAQEITRRGLARLGHLAVLSSSPGRGRSTRTASRLLRRPAVNRR